MHNCTITIIRFAHRFVVLGSKLDGRGHLGVYRLGSQKLEPLAEASPAKAVKCGTFGASSLEDRHLTVGDFDGNVHTWDLEDLSK